MDAMDVATEPPQAGSAEAESAGGQSLLRGQLLEDVVSLHNRYVTFLASGFQGHLDESNADRQSGNIRQLQVNETSESKLVWLFVEVGRSSSNRNMMKRLQFTFAACSALCPVNKDALVPPIRRSLLWYFSCSCHKARCRPVTKQRLGHMLKRHIAWDMRAVQTGVVGLWTPAF